jgi:hypothetical protein
VTVSLREDGTRLDNLELVYTGTYTEPETLPIVAKIIYGAIRVDESTLIEEINFAQMFVVLLDVETLGDRYIQHVQVDRFGRYQFDNMGPGNYLLLLQLPPQYFADVNEVMVTATVESPVEINFNVAQKVQHLYLPILMYSRE